MILGLIIMTLVNLNLEFNLSILGMGPPELALILFTELLNEAYCPNKL